MRPSWTRQRPSLCCRRISNQRSFQPRRKHRRSYQKSTRRKKSKAALISATGVLAEATVTFVDRNYRILVNEQPVYSIVEYKFLDTSGTERVFRAETVDAETVIRNQIQVGSTLNVKYLADDPSENILMLENPGATT